MTIIVIIIEKDIVDKSNFDNYHYYSYLYFVLKTKNSLILFK